MNAGIGWLAAFGVIGVLALSGCSNQNAEATVPPTPQSTAVLEREAAARNAAAQVQMRNAATAGAAAQAAAQQAQPK